MGRLVTVEISKQWSDAYEKRKWDAIAAGYREPPQDPKQQQLDALDAGYAGYNGSSQQQPQIDTPTPENDGSAGLVVIVFLIMGLLVFGAFLIW